MENKENKIIVIIPVRNESKLLGPTLDALKKQTLVLHRIIVINDGSTDDTSSIAKKFNVEVVDLKDRGFRATGKPVLANVINKGLEKILENDVNML
ncbi:MAG: glycosyltransferase [Nitrosopumilus sp.]